MFEHLNIRVNDRNINYKNASVSPKERQVLRELASRVAELAARPEQEEKKSSGAFTMPCSQPARRFFATLKTAGTR